MDGDRGGQGEHGRGKGVIGLKGHWGALEFLTQDSYPSGTTLVDARNGFN